MSNTNKPNEVKEDPNAYCKENCKGYQETGKCYCDGRCDAYMKAQKQNEEPEQQPDIMDAMNEALQHATKTINKVREDYNIEHDRYIRALADYQNLQRNSAIQISNGKRDGKIAIIKALLPVLDNFENAIAANDITEGTMLVYNGLMKILKDNNVEVINPADGDDFNDALQEAMFVIPGAPEEKKNKVGIVQMKGYKLGDTIIRFAKVGVYV